MAAEAEGSHSSRLGPLITTISGVVGLVVAIAALDIERSWRIVALTVGMIGIGLSLLAVRVAPGRRALTGLGVSMLLAAATVLVFAPPEAERIPAPPRARLAASQLDVVGGTQGPVSLDMTVHNIGTRRAVLTGLRLTFRHFTYLPTCYTAGTVEASKPYPLTLPDQPQTGSAQTIPLHEEVGTDEVDRFVVQLHEPPPRRVRDINGTYTEGAGFGYQVDVAVTSDVQKDLRLGQAVFVVPLNPQPVTVVWNPDDPQRASRWASAIGAEPADLETPELTRAMSCLDANSNALADLLDLPGARTDELAHTLTAVQP